MRSGFRTHPPYLAAGVLAVAVPAAVAGAVSGVRPLQMGGSRLKSWGYAGFGICFYPRGAVGTSLFVEPANWNQALVRGFGRLHVSLEGTGEPPTCPGRNTTIPYMQADRLGFG